MEASSTIVTRALMLFAALAAVPLWVMSGLTVDDVLRPFRGDTSAAPAPRTQVDLGQETNEFPFDRLGGGGDARSQPPAEDRTGAPAVEIAIPGFDEGEPAAEWPSDGDAPPSPQIDQPFWNGEPPIAASPLKDPDVNRGPPIGTTPQPSEPEPGTADIDSLLRRLDDLGAVNMNSTRMSRGQAYRFRCEFPIPGNAALRRYFETTDVSEQQAVSRVLAEARHWRETKSQY